MFETPASPSRGLTDQEIEVLSALSALTRQLDRPPRLSELAVALGYAGRGSLAKPLMRLRALGLVEPRPKGSYPGIQLARPEGRQLRRFRARRGRPVPHGG